ELDEAFPGLIRVLDRLGEVDHANAVSAVWDLRNGETLEPDEPIDDVPARPVMLKDFALDGEARWNSVFEGIRSYLPTLFPGKEPNPPPPQHELSKLATRIGQSMGLARVEVGLVKEAPLCAPAIAENPRIE